jgi:hypothetical protein
MRATKAYIASLGTTGLLLASAGSLLLVVGALFAFNGWPGGQVSDPVDSLVVDEQRPFPVTGPEQVARDAAPAARAVARSGRGGGAQAPGGGDAGTGTGGGTDTSGTIEGGGDGSGDGGGAPGGGGGGGGTGLPPVDTGGPTDALADATEQTTRAAGDALGGVSPQAGNGVSDTGQALSDIVRDLPDVKVGSGGVSVGN